MRLVPRLAKEEQKLEMTPMIDVTFLLLIFFLVATTFTQVEGKLYAFLPKDVGLACTFQSPPVERVEVVVRVRSAGRRMQLDGREPWTGPSASSPRFRFVDRVVEYQVGPRRMRDLRELEARLASLHSADPERPLRIDARPGAVYSDVVAALDAAVHAEFDEISFVGNYGAQ